jgi:hypothetical protein
VVIGVLIALYDKNKLLKLNIGIIQAILSTVFIAFGFLLIKITTGYVEPIALGSISLTGAGLLGLMVAGSTKNLYVRHMNTNTKSLLLAAAIIFAVFEVVSIYRSRCWRSFESHTCHAELDGIYACRWLHYFYKSVQISRKRLSGVL